MVYFILLFNWINLDKVMLHFQEDAKIQILQL